MPSGQISVWVPIVVAVLGIVGVIAGQLINSRREDRRWTREKERDDRRWQRERDLQVKLHWREERLGRYAEFVDAISKLALKVQIVIAWAMREGRKAPDSETILSHARGEANAALSALRIIGSPAVQQQAAKVIDKLWNHADEILNAPDDALSHVELESLSRSVDNPAKDLLPMMQADLGVD